VTCVVDVVALLQGDVEKNLGWKPIPLFDRDNYAEVASMQVMFFRLHHGGEVHKGSIIEVRSLLNLS
jgi:hypothetical protein